MIEKFTPEQFEASKSRDLLKLECSVCCRDFKITKHRVCANRRKGKGHGSYCSIACASEGKRTSVYVDCAECGRAFTRRPSQLKELNFCSNSCSATYFNNIAPKRFKDWSSVTIGDVPRMSIGSHARSVAIKHSQSMSCQKCGYDLHVDACHIRAVKDFPKDTPISIVNDPSNLVLLCKNHHWELDNGHLDIGACGGN